MTKLLRGAVALLCLGLAGVAHAADSFSISSESTQGLNPATHTVSMENDADVQGFVLAIGWDNAAVEVSSIAASSRISRRRLETTSSSGSSLPPRPLTLP